MLMNILNSIMKTDTTTRSFDVEVEKIKLRKSVTIFNILSIIYRKLKVIQSNEKSSYY